MSDRTLLVCIDGLDWKRLRSGIRAGRLTQFERLLAQGAYAEVAVKSAIPGLTWPETDINSPTLWTTVATGQYYFQHGIYDFRSIEDSAENPPLFESRHVRSPRIWDVLSHYGHSSLVVGYYVTHPAYPVRGVMVSDLFGEVESADTVAPRQLAPEISRILESADIGGAALVRGRIASEARLLSAPPQATVETDQGECVRRILSEFTRLSDTETRELLDSEARAALRRLIEFRLVYPVLRDERFHRVFLELLGREAYSFATVYYRMLDFVSHGFWNEGTGADPEFARRYGDVVDRAYVWIDQRIAEICDELCPGDRLMVLSDHGFAANPAASGSPGGQPGLDKPLGTHAEPATLLVSGGPARGEIRGMNLLDIAPSILDFLGIPQADSLDGGPVPGLLCEEAPRPLPRIPHYPYSPPTAAAAISAQEEQVILERLAALGYIE